MKGVMISRVKLEREDRCLVDFVLDNAGITYERAFSLKKDEPLMIRLNDVEVDMNEFVGAYKENKILRAKLGLAIEALKFYADSDCYERFGRYDMSEIDEDGGETARNVLEEIEKC
jgi:hypothetical protein